MSKKNRIPTDGTPAAWANPFATLKEMGFPVTVSADSAPAAPDTVARKNRGRVDILRQTAHRGGKTVTVVSGFTVITSDEMKALAKKMQSACGAGGTVKEGRIEIQGDHRDIVAQILTAAGFRIKGN